jgi:hypothetical protein
MTNQQFSGKVALVTGAGVACTTVPAITSVGTGVDCGVKSPGPSGVGLPESSGVGLGVGSPGSSGVGSRVGIGVGSGISLTKNLAWLRLWIWSF